MNTKRSFLFAMAFILSLGAIYAQGEMEALKMSQNDLKGTARSVSMGGAFGALGGDISGISINPAGIGVYRGLEVVTTMNFQNTKTKSTSFAAQEDASKFKFAFDNFGFVTSLPTFSDFAPVLNFGFTYNKIKSFDRKYKMMDSDLGSSLTDYLAYRAGAGNGFSTHALDVDNNSEAWRNAWMPVVGYSGYLINETAPGSKKYVSSMRYTNNYGDGLLLDNKLNVKEKGSINSYDFNMGTMLADMVSLGLTVSVTDIDYKLSSTYSEDFYDYPGAANYMGGFDLVNQMKTEGTGWQVALGTIIKPIEEVRIGIAYHSPTWYKMTDYFYTDLDYGLSGIQGTPNIAIRPPAVGGYDGSLGSPSSTFDYKLRTPDRWTFSLAGIIARSLIVSVDYELTNYKGSRLHDRDGNSLETGDWNPNTLIEKDFRRASTLRVGAEYSITPQFLVRAGYAWMQSPLQTKFKNNEYEVGTVGAIPHYVLDGDIHHITYGLGYRFTKRFYVDVAFVNKFQKSDLYAFSRSAGTDGVGNSVVPERVKLKTDTFQGLLTFGYRFVAN